MQDAIERDLKAALLAGDKLKVETLKSLKNALVYEAVRLKVDKLSLSDEQITGILAREAKMRQEAIDAYSQAGQTERAESEKTEKAIIDAYLPEKLSEAEVEEAVKEEISKLDDPSMSDMGRTIGAVKAKLGAGADGALIARLVKENLAG